MESRQSMKTTGNAVRIWLLSVLLMLPAVVRAQFTFVTNNGAITITGYTGGNIVGVVSIPSTINSLSVNNIAASAFFNTGLTSVTIPNSITNIGSHAFDFCNNLTNATIIPGSGIYIGESAFVSCINLAVVTIQDNPGSLSSVG